MVFYLSAPSASAFSPSSAPHSTSQTAQPPLLQQATSAGWQLTSLPSPSSPRTSRRISQGGSSAAHALPSPPLPPRAPPPTPLHERAAHLWRSPPRTPASSASAPALNPLLAALNDYVPSENSHEVAPLLDDPAKDHDDANDDAEALLLQAAPMALDLSSAALTQAWASLSAPSPRISFLLLSYAPRAGAGVSDATAASEATAPPSLEVLLAGTHEDGWGGIKRLMLADEVRFLLLRVQDQYLLVLFFGLSVSAVRRARALGHGRTLVDAYPALQTMTVISRPSELTERMVRRKLQLPPGTPLASTLPPGEEGPPTPPTKPAPPTPAPTLPPKDTPEEQEEEAEELASSLHHDNARHSIPTNASEWGSTDDVFSTPPTPSLRDFSSVSSALPASQAVASPDADGRATPGSKPFIPPPDGWVMLSASAESGQDGVEEIKPERWSKWTALTGDTSATDSSAVLNLNLASLAAGYISQRTSVATARAPPSGHALMASPSAATALELDELSDGEEDSSAIEQAQLNAVLVASIAVDPDEAQRLEREREEFVAWQREQAEREAALESERAKRKEAARVRAEEERRDKLMEKLSKEQRKWCGSMPMAAASRIERQQRSSSSVSHDTASSDTRASRNDTNDSRADARFRTTDSRATTSTAATGNSVHGIPSVDDGAASRSSSAKLSRMSEEESAGEQLLQPPLGSDKSTKKSASLLSVEARYVPTLSGTLAAPPSSKASSFSTVRRSPSSSPPNIPLPRSPSERLSSDADGARSSTELLGKGNDQSPVPSSCLEPTLFPAGHPRSSPGGSRSASNGSSTMTPFATPLLAASSAAAATLRRPEITLNDGRSPPARPETIEAARAAAAATLVDARFRQPEADLGTQALGLWLPSTEAKASQVSKWSVTTIDNKTQHSNVSSMCPPATSPPPVPPLPLPKAERLFLEGESWLDRQMRSRLAADREAQVAAKARPRSKALPPPPPLSDEELDDPRWLNASHSDRRVLEARRRAHAADKAARAQIEVARLEQRRLAFEVSEAERRNREREQAEFWARAKWAREQAVRDQLGAYERSQLESEERRRRAAVQRMKEEEESRAAAARREQEQRELDEREAVAVAERVARSRARREAQLREQAEAATQRQEEAQRRWQAKMRAREALREDFEALYREGELALDGWINVQTGGVVPSWRRRWFMLRDHSLSLCKAQGEPVLEHLELRGSIAAVEEIDEEGRMLHSFRIQWTAPRGGGAQREPLVAFADSEDDAEVLIVGLRMLASL